MTVEAPCLSCFDSSLKQLGGLYRGPLTMLKGVSSSSADARFGTYARSASLIRVQIKDANAEIGISTAQNTVRIMGNITTENQCNCLAKFVFLQLACLTAPILQKTFIPYMRLLVCMCGMKSHGTYATIFYDDVSA